MSSATNARAWDTIPLCVSTTRLMARQHFQEDKEALPREDAMDARRGGTKLSHAPTWRMKPPWHQGRGSPASKQSKTWRRQARTSITFATLAGPRDILVRIVPWVTLLSLTLSIMISICLGRTRMALVLLRWLVHLMVAQRSFGCLSLLWLTLMDPTWIGYQNVLERLNRYLEMHWRLGLLERKFIGHILQDSLKIGLSHDSLKRVPSV